MDRDTSDLDTTDPEAAVAGRVGDTAEADKPAAGRPLGDKAVCMAAADTGPHRVAVAE